MEFLKKFADYFIYMDKGKIVEQGDIEKLKSPKTDKLIKFLER